MIIWRDMQAVFLIALLMLGVLVAAVFVRLQGFDYVDQLRLSGTVVPVKVNGAVSITRPLVNPVLRINQPPVSIFAAKL